MQTFNRLLFSTVFTVQHFPSFVMALQLLLHCHISLTYYPLFYIYMTYFSFYKIVISGDYITNVSVQHLKTTFPMSRWTSATKEYTMNTQRIVHHSFHWVVENIFLTAEHQQWNAAVWSYKKQCPTVFIKL